MRVVVAVPVTGSIMSEIGKMTDEIQQRVDKGVGLMNEFIHPIHIIKDCVCGRGVSLRGLTRHE